jgi:hypothetical protein
VVAPTNAKPWKGKKKDLLNHPNTLSKRLLRYKLLSSENCKIPCVKENLERTLITRIGRVKTKRQKEFFFKKNKNRWIKDVAGGKVEV